MPAMGWGSNSSGFVGDFTIWDELGLYLEEDNKDKGKEVMQKMVQEEPFIVMMLNNLKHGQMVHSLAMLLAHSSMKHELIL